MASLWRWMLFAVCCITIGHAARGHDRSTKRMHFLFSKNPETELQDSNHSTPSPTSLTIGNASYSEEDATRSLYFAYGAYCEQKDIESWTCKWCQHIPGFEVGNVSNQHKLQVFTGFDRDHDQIVISFRGTHNIYDWLDNLDAVQMKYPHVDGGYVHKGFYEAWKDDLEKSIMPSITELMTEHRGKSMLITGHSLGAALAQLCALDVAQIAGNESTIYLYTFGSPRWGNKKMAQYFESMVDFHFRLVNEKDMVPTLPYESMGRQSRYHHSWTEIWYKKDKPLKYKECDGSGEDPDCSYIGYSIDDHLNYLGKKESCV